MESRVPQPRQPWGKRDGQRDGVFRGRLACQPPTARTPNDLLGRIAVKFEYLFFSLFFFSFFLISHGLRFGFGLKCGRIIQACDGKSEPEVSTKSPAAIDVQPALRGGMQATITISWTAAIEELIIAADLTSKHTQGEEHP